jgi:hypothetical protein
MYNYAHSYGLSPKKIAENGEESFLLYPTKGFGYRPGRNRASRPGKRNPGTLQNRRQEQ